MINQSIEKLRLDLRLGHSVEIDYDVLNQICKSIINDQSFREYRPYAWDDPDYWPEKSKDRHEISQYFAVGNALNFRFWQFKQEENTAIERCEGKKGGIECGGALYMWRSLKVCHDKEVYPILDAKKLSKIALKDLKKIFEDDNGRMPMPASQDRKRNWQDLGNKLSEYWGGEFHNLLQEAENSLFSFIQYSRQFRAFDDPLCKMTMVNAVFHQGRGLTKFSDSIFPGIDYQLMKQQLRIGALIPEKTVRDKLIQLKLLSRDEARELRNACLKSFLYIMEHSGIPGDIIDNRWWFNRGKCKDEKPVCEDPDTIDTCPFSKVCRKRVEYMNPLEITRYY